MLAKNLMITATAVVCSFALVAGVSAQIGASPKLDCGEGWPGPGLPQTSGQSATETNGGQGYQTVQEACAASDALLGPLLVQESNLECNDSNCTGDDETCDATADFHPSNVNHVPTTLPNGNYVCQSSLSAGKFYRPLCTDCAQ